MDEIEHLKAMANDALSQYASETFTGGEPIYPQWAEDMLKVCDQAACYQWLKEMRKTDTSISATGRLMQTIWPIWIAAIHDSMQRKI